jgi:transcriptional regulator with XRE-family HTH domain
MPIPTRRVITPQAHLLRDVRHERGISISDLAEASGVARAHISQIENGLRCATVREQSLLAAALGIPKWRVTLRTYLVIEELV